MGKRNFTLYVDDELVSLAIARKINISRLFNEIMSTELKYKELSDTTTKEELIEKLKSRVSILSGEIKVLNEKIEVLEKENKILQEKVQKQDKKIRDKSEEDKGIWIT